MIEFDNVSYSYRNDNSCVKALNRLSFKVKEGQFVSITGPVGCGKSTAARMFNALLIPDNGKVYVDGLDTSEQDNAVQIRKTVGIVFQNPLDQIVCSTVEDEVAFGPENMGLEGTEIEMRVEQSLEDLGISDLRYSSISSLSGGSLQKVCCAAVIATRSRYVVFDECVTMLETDERISFVEKLYSVCRNRGISVIYITHNTDECLLSDRIIVMENGSIISDATPRNTFEKPDLIKKAGLELPVPVRISMSLNIPLCLSAEEMATYLK